MHQHGEYSDSSWLCKSACRFAGFYCEENIDDCVMDPCVNGTCVDDVATFHCHCDAGFHGDNCELEADECLSTPCGYESTCLDDVNGYR